ncbi:Na/Pi cotransporter family protein [Aminipila butyrica]|uniref:Na/Pi cotransporter family protein n=1 Tax=Aminipila butyrica TaxID=433296 RepID=A0A858BW22_9FIRM|nr:Na/Pi cotransporter family protein [Aminipila butyrica]QIB69265.1 Na/Pi cotransporter family protein [Aminipila butyrica]
MEMNGFQVLITLVGSVAVFIYGMNLMSDGLQRAAGERMRKLLAYFTKNPLMGVLAGALTAAVLQSSSATTVMVIGFVSAGLMNLPQAICMVLGANIGATATSQLIAFQIGNYFWLLILVGFLLQICMKKETWINVGQAIFAFGLLFLSMNLMGTAMGAVAASPKTGAFFLWVQELPIIGVLAGAAVTMAFQSSTASIALIQSLGSQAVIGGAASAVSLQSALAMVLGTNIGTTITAALASVGSTANAKRTAAAHIIFNVAGMVLFLIFLPLYVNFIQFISPAGPEYDVLARQVANGHMFFNLINTLIFLPFLWLLVKAVVKLIPGKDADKLPAQPQYLDYNIIEQPVFAIHLATKELLRMGGFALQMIKDTKKAFIANDTDAVKSVFKTEAVINGLQQETVKYLASIFATDTLTEHQGKLVSGLIHIASDLEHIGDNCVNITEFAEEKMRNGYEFSDIACAEIYECFDQANRMTSTVLKALEESDAHLAQDLLLQEEEMNRTEERLKKQHIKRLYDKSCSPEFTVMYTDIIHNIERIGDSCKKIADAVLSDIQFNENNLTNREI